MYFICSLKGEFLMVETTEITNVPPYTNRGVQNTEREGLTACVDWFSCTFVEEKNVDEIIRILGFTGTEFQKSASGRYGYKKAVFFDHISVLYDGQTNMGVHVEMSGQGCRTFEKYSNLNWQELFLRFEVHDVAKVNVTRIDLAIDDFQGYFKIPTLIKYLKKGHVTSLFRIAKHIENIVIATGQDKGHTLYFGRPTSDIQVRFYEKNIEQEMKGTIVPEHAQIWNRTEIQARDERAEAFVYLIARNTFDLGKIVTGTLKNYITFRRSNYVNGKLSKDLNKSRWDTAKFWLNFLGKVEKLKLTMKPVPVTIERKYKWVNHSVKKTLAMLAFAFPEDYEDMIYTFIDEGHSKFEDKDWDVIYDFKHKNLNLEEFKEKMFSFGNHKKSDIKKATEEVNFSSSTQNL